MVIKSTRAKSGFCNIDDVITHAAVVTVMGMSGHDGSSSGMSGHHYERVRIILRSDILEELRDLGIDVNTVVNKLLENFLVAYKAFWKMYRTPGVGFEPTRAKPIGLADRRLTTRQPRLHPIPDLINSVTTFKRFA